MAWDDPIVWVLIIAVVIFLFGASRIPQLARAFGRARREFEDGMKGTPSPQPQAQQARMTSPNYSMPADQSDPLVIAAQREGIDTTGKTRQQIALELSSKLNQT